MTQESRLPKLLDQVYRITHLDLITGETHMAQIRSTNPRFGMMNQIRHDALIAFYKANDCEFVSIEKLEHVAVELQIA